MKLLWAWRASRVRLLTWVCLRWHPPAQHPNRAVSPWNLMPPLHHQDTAVSHHWCKARGELGKAGDSVHRQLHLSPVVS